ncbi:hypothetical protein [Bacillus rubiinfantis]|uniref:hypothetical protein n=1 Tax=Bacillus rubiinfantis TaxID=1499680 RepID=UPI000AB6BB7A|nr:hypothetical protein [Bacillus rubiinfantis]
MNSNMYAGSGFEQVMPYHHEVNYPVADDSRLWGGFGWGRPWGFGWGRPWGFGWGRPWGFGFGAPIGFGFGFGYPFFGGFPFFI